MHSSLHSLAHRAPSATRTRVRWQPYSSLDSSSAALSNAASSSSLSRPTKSINAYHTPSSSSDNSSPSTLTSASSCDERSRKPLAPTLSKESIKQKQAVSLVEQTVKLLSDTWHPQDIPPVFLTTTRSPNAPEPLIAQGCPPPVPAPVRNTQLPSPISPSTHASPISTREADPSLFSSSKSNLVPLPRFVHEVLRRSRTSGHILQTALCYIDALRPRVAELVDLEKSGTGTSFRPALDSVIIEGTEADIAAASDDPNFTAKSASYPEEDLVATVRVTDESELDFQLSGSAEMLSTATGTSEALPSPLLCPRRALLASLILASKFMQDKSYSNRAWSKISGLPAREVTRCEQAMGNALGWRLWVGKAPTVDSTSNIVAPSLSMTDVHLPATPPTGGRSLSRCQSENNVLGSSNALRPSSAFLIAPEDLSAIPSSSHLRRSATLPNGELFARQPVQHEATWEHRPVSHDLLQVPQGNATTQRFSSTSHAITPASSPPGLTYSPSSTVCSSMGGYTDPMSSLEDTAISPMTGYPVSGKPAVTISQPWIMDNHYPLAYNIAQDGLSDVSARYWVDSQQGIQWNQV